MNEEFDGDVNKWKN